MFTNRVLQFCVFWAKTVHVTKMLHDEHRVFYHQYDPCFKDRMIRCIIPQYSIIHCIVLYDEHHYV